MRVCLYLSFYSCCFLFNVLFFCHVFLLSCVFFFCVLSAVAVSFSVCVCVMFLQCDVFNLCACVCLICAHSVKFRRTARVLARACVCVCVTTLQRRQTASAEMQTVEMQQHLRESSNNSSKNKKRVHCLSKISFNCMHCLPDCVFVFVLHKALLAHRCKHTLQLSSTCRQCRKCVRSLSLHLLFTPLSYLWPLPKFCCCTFFC